MALARTRRIELFKIGATTFVKITDFGKTKTFSTDRGRQIETIPGGVLIIPDNDSNILNNLKILISELVNDLGAATDEDLHVKIRENGYFISGVDAATGGNNDNNNNMALNNVENFMATAGQNSYRVGEGKIIDDGFAETTVNGVVWNSQTGLISFTEGNISIDFATGTITFHIPLEIGDQVIIKYN